MTYVITGAHGYIGSALAKRLAREGHALRLVSRALRAAEIGADDGVERVRADLRDEASWAALLRDAKAIVHLSARTDLRAAEADPAGDRNLNVEPVRALVRAATRFRNPLPVIFASTVTIVGDKHINPVNELTPDQPCSVYDRHKLECETMLRDATRRGQLRACSLRLSNVYGYGDGVSSTNSNRGILNAVMRRAGQGEALILYGQGRYIRDFTFVGDVVDAFCRALASDRVRDGGHYVIATGRGHSLAEAFKMAAQEAFRSTGRRVEIRHVSEPPDLHPIERRNFVGDASAFRKLTDWHAKVDLESGIRDYFERAAAGSQTGRAPHEVA